MCQRGDRGFEAGDQSHPVDYLSRRQWLVGAAFALPGLATSTWAQAPPKPEGDPAVIRQVEERARKAGLGPIATTSTKHFLGLGDAPDRYRADALDICEKQAQAFLAYFQQHGFKVAFPNHLMTVVILKDAASYQAYTGQPPLPGEGGHYDLESNQLVVFDFRAQQDGLAAKAARVNTFTLVHETTHLLCFNTGLLSRKADVPACISEGLATYFELWQPRGRAAIGRTNGARLGALTQAVNGQGEWIPIAKLLADDKWFDDPATVQLAYAESWLLVHYLLKTPDRLPKFQAYLSGIPQDRGAQRRQQAAGAQFGSLEALDKAVKHHARRELER
jgi:hypothetical protein